MAIESIRELPNFQIQQDGIISKEFLDRGITTFHDACIYIQQLPYRRNTNKSDLSTIFQDGQGTCSTKHALLKQLATENGIEDLILMMGIFKMQASNTPAIAKTLAAYGLDLIPEAHMYLKYGENYYDFTRVNSSSQDFLEELLFEIAMPPANIGQQKVALHQAFLAQWLQDNPQIKLTTTEIWQIREQCIQDLSS
ncbi:MULTISPECIES: hypothetical protein [Sphingobacterium]|uniref:Transglutaminase-like domain-containing protein n=1 Tax=Sphingobacterium populi TaxID=1812824 RepID=A0ABW5UGG4_9SPHI|nr:hypothetical protein [Sphingobacterium sp. CFCC 11742]